MPFVKSVKSWGIVEKLFLLSQASRLPEILGLATHARIRIQHAVIGFAKDLSAAVATTTCDLPLPSAWGDNNRMEPLGIKLPKKLRCRFVASRHSIYAGGKGYLVCVCG